MHSAARAFALATVSLTVLVFVTPCTAQQATSSPTPVSIASSTTPANANNTAQDPANAAPAKPAPTPEPDLWHREKATGDWGGDRNRLKDEGLEMDFRLSQFYQGVTSGGLKHNDVYNGKFEFTMKLDFGKMSKRWQWWSSEIKAEWRFGAPLLTGTGGINPVNTATI